MLMNKVSVESAGQATKSPVRLMLMQNETIGVDAPGHAERVRIVSGRAWLTHEGSDIFLDAGQEYMLKPSVYQAVISSLEVEPLVVELLASPN